MILLQCFNLKLSICGYEKTPDEASRLSKSDI